jgi:signal transduction histidine kinase
VRASLRWKILVFAVVTPATLGISSLLIVNRNVTAHVSSSSIHESLDHSQAVFEAMLRSRSRALLGNAQVIAGDPRFFSLVMLDESQRDAHYRLTVRGMARDFNRVVQSDLFEVFDRHGVRLASGGPSAAPRGDEGGLVIRALRGKTVEAVLVEDDAHYQVALVPVMAGRRVVGVLLLGSRIGTGLARELRAQMRCEVTFLSGTTVTGTSLDTPGDAGALLMALRSWRRAPGDVTELPVQRVHAAHSTYLTLVRRFPLSDPETDQIYVIQRAFDPEMAFLDVMEKDMLVLALIALLAALVTGLYLSEQILRPIQSLVRGAQEMEKGNYDHPLGIRRRDELGYLADRFAEMRQRERAYLSGLEQATRLKSHFLSIASHELRTPISVLIGYRDLLAAGELGAVSPAQREVLDTMRKHLERLTRLAEDAAHFARVKSERMVLHFESHPFESLLRRTVTLAETAGASRAVEVVVRCDPAIGEVEADYGALERALFQLVTNAIRFTPDGGHVRVSAEAADGRLRVTIEDDGVGMEPPKLEAMLSSEFSVPEPVNYRSPTGLEFNAAGLGLGFPVARAIIEAHGGTIAGESRVGEGTRFVVEIPLRQDGEARPAA